MPRFSIVIPSTRPHLLNGALQSALTQSFDDFEVIISDNSSEGDKKEFYEKIDRRIKYFSPEQYLTVSDHWNFAMNKASGEWQLLLCDDDAILSSTLAILDKTIKANPSIQAIRWKHAAYQHDGPGKGELSFSAGTAGNSLTPNHDLMASIFNEGTVTGALKNLTPNMPMAACRIDLLSNMKGLTGGKVFLPIEPMTSMSMLAMALTDVTLSLDLPLTIIGWSTDSATGSVRESGDGSTVFEKTNADSKFKRIPVGLPKVFPAWKAETLLMLQAHFPEQFGSFTFNYSNYFRHCYRAILEIDNSGKDAKHEFQRFYNDLLLQPMFVLLNVGSFIVLNFIKTLSLKAIIGTGRFVKKCLHFKSKGNMSGLKYGDINKAANRVSELQFGEGGGYRF